ncbi:hypothetical protein C9374_010354 [Naegleria lovaniensis]|uniref:PARP catalytic domain-containing protein n=1 Tax=Naegleria lovaniensis TaxID=51637 RepID=A0AA88GGE3_NAELO|nr:uncharacterized protein C9374_010354 [Naegleria lovaniensis]KAG2374980.1 hypothetical protein C9374_010354 [Naegleria lovaniensis]
MIIDSNHEDTTIELTVEEIMCLSEEDLKEMGLSREELLELAAPSSSSLEKDENHLQQEEDSLEQPHHSDDDDQEYDDDEYEHDYGFTSAFDDDQDYRDEIDREEELIEMDILVDEESFKEFEQQECVETKIEELPWFNAILEENYRLMFGEITLEELKSNAAATQESSNSTDQKPQRSNISKKNRLKKEMRLQQSNYVSKMKVLDFPDFIEPIQFWPQYQQMIKKRFHNYHVKNIESIVNPYLLDRFKNAIQKEQERLKRKVSSRIVLCFHGTHSSNIPSIIEKGLLVPGKNNHLQVVNGSSWGVGIYLSVMDPSISVSYCVGGNQLFACAVLLTDTVNTKNHGSFLVIMEEAYVLPCFLVTFERVDRSARPLSQKQDQEKVVAKTKKGEVVFSKKRKEEQREKLRKKKEEKKKLINN